MNRLLQSDLTKVLIFLILTTVSAAILSPWLFNAGKMIAEVVPARSHHSLLLWFAQKCDNAEFLRYFNRSLLISALLLAGPFIMWMRIGKPPTFRGQNPWTFRLPTSSLPPVSGQPLRANDRFLLHLGTGVFLASGLMLMMMWILLLSGWFVLEEPVLWWDAVKVALITALPVALIEECLFRGVLLGICLRSMRPAAAITVVSIGYASVHFLSPLDGVHLSHPGNLDAGFQMLGLIGQRFLQLHTFFLPWLTLFGIGLILAYARYRSASLWLPIGLHLGWTLIHRTFQPIVELSDRHPAMADLLISPDRKTGILPLSVLLATGILVHVFTRISTEARSTREEKNMAPVG
ncbi:CPBP family intramembrane metalloprotease [Verrucomicrobiaceae bacterium R5-34]|nr:CPBP family intramembrane metalloprotease [Verrucomicrobiaceae bacterium R5-34]